MLLGCRGADVDTGPNSYLEHLRVALMISGDVRSGSWSAFTNLICLHFDSESSKVRNVDFPNLPGERVSAALDAGTGQVSAGTSRWDAIVGVRGRACLGASSWSVRYYADVGAGSSQLTWQALVGVGYAFGWGAQILAYRHLACDEGDEKLLQNFRCSGPAVGATFRF